MTALRIVDKYVELYDVPSGSYTPTQINYYIDQIVSGSITTSGSWDSSASYIVVSLSSSLPNARRLIAGDGIIVSENPASGTISVTVDDAYIRSLIQWNEVPTGTIDDINTSFSLAYTPNPQQSLSLYYNGQLLEEGSGNDYIVSGTNITTLFSPRVSDKLRATYSK